MLNYGEDHSRIQTSDNSRQFSVSNLLRLGNRNKTGQEEGKDNSFLRLQIMCKFICHMCVLLLFMDVALLVKYDKYQVFLSYRKKETLVSSFVYVPC